MTSKGSIKDFGADILRLQAIKAEGNQLINTDVSGAIKKYDEANKDLLAVLRTTSEREKDTHPQLKQIDAIKTQLSSNLALCYFKLKEYAKSIEYDKSIISIDSNYDKSYARLCKCSVALNDLESAARYGRILKVWFNQETLDKYPDVIQDAESAEIKIKLRANTERGKEERKVKKRKILKSIPYLLAISAAAIYSFFYK